MKTASVERELRELDRIVSTLNCIRYHAPPPRVITAVFYAAVFVELAFLLAPSAWGSERVLVALAVGLGMFKFLERFGPGPRTWWKRLGVQLRRYTPRDARALERLRKDLAASEGKGEDSAILRVLSWSRIELEAITAAHREGSGCA